MEEQRTPTGTEPTPGILMRALATAAIWGIAVTVAMRLKAPIVALASGGVAVALTVLVWLPSATKRE